MDNNYALVLTGSVLPGYSTESVWPALAGYFRMEPDKLSQQLLARAPLTIKQSDDLGKLQTLQAGAAAVGAEAEICAPDGRPALFVLLDGAPRGPVPRVFVEERVRHGLWPGNLSVAEVGSHAWLPFREFDAPAAAAAPPPLPAAPAAVAADDTATRATAFTPAAGVEFAGTDHRGETAILPAGEAIHAGFWRRCAAYVIDGFIAGMLGYALQLIVGIGAAFGQDPSSMMAFGLVGSVLGLVVQWLYFALQECSAAQATLGKRALGLKVTDDYGRRIGFGRASGRFFGKIVSSLILMIGYLLAGWTARKQALHDMLASTVVVFREVQPGQPLPSVRPPMPWYGWLLNILLIGAIVLGLVGFFVFAASLASLASSAAQSGSGF